MSDKFLRDEILRRDEKVNQEVERLQEKAKKHPDDVDLQARITRKIDKLLAEAKEKNETDKIRIDNYDARLDNYEENKIERRDERESKHSLHQTEVSNEVDKIEEKFDNFLDEHDQKKIEKLEAKSSLSEHEQKELERLKNKIKERDEKLKDREQKRDERLSQKQADQVDKVLEKDAKDAQKITKY